MFSLYRQGMQDVKMYLAVMHDIRMNVFRPPPSDMSTFKKLAPAPKILLDSC